MPRFRDGIRATISPSCRTVWDMTRRARRPNLVATLALAAMLVGCGGGSKHSASTASAGSSSAQTASSPSPGPPSPAAYWSYRKLVRRLSGQTVVLPHGPVRLDRALLECNGRGTPQRAGRRPRWARYTCTQTVFTGGADHDITFDVVILTHTQLKIEVPRYGTE